MNERRADDNRLNTVITDVAELKRQMEENTKVTRQIHDIMRSFKILGTIAKWTSAVGAAGTAVYHGVSFVFRHH